nr:pentatricopeptide repeat-containing protein [Quercus suber]
MGIAGSVEETRQNFDKMVDRDDISWTAVIDRYLEDGTMEEGFSLFSMLMKSVIRPNDFRDALTGFSFMEFLIVGNAQNGQPNEALKFFELPLRSGS